MAVEIRKINVEKNMSFFFPHGQRISSCIPLKSKGAKEKVFYGISSFKIQLQYQRNGEMTVVKIEGVQNL